MRASASHFLIGDAGPHCLRHGLSLVPRLQLRCLASKHWPSPPPLFDISLGIECRGRDTLLANLPSHTFGSLIFKSHCNSMQSLGSLEEVSCLTPF